MSAGCLSRTPLPRSNRYYESYCQDVLRDPYYFWIGLKALVLDLRRTCRTRLPSRLCWWVDHDGQLAQGHPNWASLLVWGVFLRTVLVWHITWTVNSLGHIYGYQNYGTGDSSHQQPVVRPDQCGDGWHNNHHAFQRYATHGHKWWEFDVTYLTIVVLRKLELASNVVTFPLTPKRAAGSLDIRSG